MLLVEDDNVCIQVCTKFLMKYGCSVDVASDGLNAITNLETQRYDLVLMDIVMPNLDGATATSIVRSFDNETPIIAMTGNIDDEDLVTYLQNGMTDILAKPFTKNDLYSMLVRYLKNRIPISQQNALKTQNPSHSPHTGQPSTEQQPLDPVQDVNMDAVTGTGEQLIKEEQGSVGLSAEGSLNQPVDTVQQIANAKNINP